MPYETMSDDGFGFRFDDNCEIETFASDNEYFEYLADKASAQE